MSFIHFPSEFVYFDKVCGHSEIKQKCMPKITELRKKRQNNPFTASKLNTSFHYDEKMFSENEFLNDNLITQNVVWKPIEKMIKKYNELRLHPIDIGASVIKSCWWNYYEKDNFQESHNHMGPSVQLDGHTLHASLSIIYILHDENRQSSVLFRKTGPLPLKPLEETITIDTSNSPIGEGTVIIFPSNLEHFVKPCLKPGRVTIAFNIYSEYKQMYP